MRVIPVMRAQVCYLVIVLVSRSPHKAETFEAPARQPIIAPAILIRIKLGNFSISPGSFKVRSSDRPNLQAPISTTTTPTYPPAQCGRSPHQRAPPCVHGLAILSLLPAPHGSSRLLTSRPQPLHHQRLRAPPPYSISSNGVTWVVLPVHPPLNPPSTPRLDAQVKRSR